MLGASPKLKCPGTSQPPQVLAFILSSWISLALNRQASPKKMNILELVVVVAIGSTTFNLNTESMFLYGRDFRNQPPLLGLANNSHGM